MVNQPSVQDTPQTTNTEAFPKNIPPEHKKKSKTWLIILMGLVLLGASGVAGYYVYQNYQLKKNPVEEVKPSPSTELIEPSSSLNPSQNPKIGWEIYMNDDFGFQVKYPPDWVFNFSSGQAFLFQAFLKKEDNSQDNILMLGDQSLIPYYHVIISVQDNQQNLSAKEFYLKNFSSESIQDIESEIEEVRIDGKNAIKYQEAIAPASGPATTVSIAYNNKIYQLSYGAMTHDITHNKYIDTFNQILSTFKFIDKDDETADWETFTNLEFLNFSIKYPKDWVVKENDVPGNFCFVSPDFFGLNQGIGGGFEIQSGALVCVSYLEEGQTGDEYHKLICNQKGTIKGNGEIFTCSTTTVSNISAFKTESSYGDDYKSLSINFEENNHKIYSLMPVNQNFDSIINQIISTFKLL